MFILRIKKLKIGLRVILELLIISHNKIKDY